MKTSLYQHPEWQMGCWIFLDLFFVCLFLSHVPPRIVLSSQLRRIQLNGAVSSENSYHSWPVGFCDKVKSTGFLIQNNQYVNLISMSKTVLDIEGTGWSLWPFPSDCGSFASVWAAAWCLALILYKHRCVYVGVSWWTTTVHTSLFQRGSH